MGIPQTRPFVKDNIDFDIQFVADVVGLQALNMLDGLCEAHGQVQEDISLVRGSGLAGEVADMLVCGVGPVEDDIER
jgi:hypothetical protein